MELDRRQFVYLAGGSLLLPGTLYRAGDAGRYHEPAEDRIDPRFLDLLETAEPVKEWNSPATDRVVHRRGSLYALDHVVLESSYERLQDYFGDEGRKGFWKAHLSANNEIVRVGAPTTSILWIDDWRVLEDGTVQVAGFGDEWSTEKGTAWALYGHLQLEE